MWPFKKHETYEQMLARFHETHYSVAELIRAGWTPYGGQRDDELLEWRRPFKDDVPYLARAADFAPEFNVANLWWRRPNIIDVTPTRGWLQ